MDSFGVIMAEEGIEALRSSDVEEGKGKGALDMKGQPLAGRPGFPVRAQGGGGVGNEIHVATPCGSITCIRFEGSCHSAISATNAPLSEQGKNS